MNLIDQIIADEGFSRFAYQCPLGRWTIGYGRNIDQMGGRGISEVEARILLQNDLVDCDNGLAEIFTFEIWSSLDSVRRNALINMRFQLGPGGFRTFTNLIAAVKRKQWTLAQNEVLDSKYALQVPRRAQRIAFEIGDGIAI